MTIPSRSPAAAFTVLIPARMASSRLPDKPLADIGGLPMVVRVARQAERSHATQVVVAADDARIEQACAEHRVRCLRTRADHPSGSDRLAEAVELLGLDDQAIVVNVQGDEPFIEPALIDATAALLAAQPDAVMGTAAHAIDDAADFQNPNVVKLVLNGQQQAQYFSRAPIPCCRDARQPDWWHDASAPGATAWHAPLRHIGIYSYRAGFLRTFPALTAAPTEQTESLEQLRVLWHGHRIAVHVSTAAPLPGVDTQADLERARQHALALVAAQPRTQHK
ncbi:3-deoxy-manno-octulosonate cytidylyltransferase [Corticibacter populi]|uniref:3-deoxy-manno-octulosonate cytidylyltransferase n=1 Tax=Corticibacter populi TaxID=1550736 RepID=A0A3M6QME6_9BURK|nr:3-deoxy-manno-octulosonate cytidylyltransferase [Corticibacter populi]RMX03582.1 3-deoxy-manno-octulosonate cytidylyltransferase [Corticibacter populi]RZS30037.1 3-deoxy-manno-octulosonate cytidylyltransferase (CMP-KDO synthetase) [Corticibacter populi]